MKITVLLLSLASTASAFQMAPTTRSVATTTSLSASTTGDDMKPNDWTGYPVGVKKSTTPVPVRKVNSAQRAMMSDVMLDPDFSLTWALAALGPLIMWYHPCKSRDKDLNDQ